MVELTAIREVADTPRINDQGGFITTTGNCHLNSPDIVFGRAFGTPGSLFAANGTTTLSSSLPSGPTAAGPRQRSR